MISIPGARRAVLPLLMLALTLAACGPLRRTSPAVDRTQDSRIREEVMVRLQAEPSLDAAALRVEVDGAVVLLYGNVAGIGGWNCALRNAQLVGGVRTVVDYLQIDRGPREVECAAPR